MADISAATVKQLRETTDAGMMECKRALTDADGDFDAAVKLVRERTGAKMSRKASERSATEGLVHAYLHTPSPGLPPKVGVMVELNCETDFVAKGPGFRELAGEIALHIAAAQPEVVRDEDIDADVVASEREIARTQAVSEGKPDHVIDKIVEGRLQTFYKERVLLRQPFVKDEERTVSDLIEDFQRTVGERVVVNRFVRYSVGG